ncbi:MAG: IS110 family transposase [Ignavibacteria bacterium]|jgi:transposase|nr:IS110 family transposase [Ignavibacteria bacterium]
MAKVKLSSADTKSNIGKSKPGEYDYYIGVDWSEKNMVIATMNRKSSDPKIVDTRTNLKDLKDYLDQLKGSTIVTIEECTEANWLYVELKEHANYVLICDPYRNRLLSDGPKNDSIDAGKLCRLLKSGLLKEVFHTSDELYELRKYVSAYEDLIKAGVRAKNQRAAIFKSEGKNFRKDEVQFKGNKFIIQVLDSQILAYEKDKMLYHELFKKIVKGNQLLRNLKKVPGIDVISSVKILANVIDAKRFPDKGKYLAYCGLVKHEKVSGMKSYGHRKPRCNRSLKSVYKSAAIAVLESKGNSEKEYYEYLIKKGLEEFNARNALARHLALITFGMLKSGEKYRPYKWRNSDMK